MERALERLMCMLSQPTCHSSRTCFGQNQETNSISGILQLYHFHGIIQAVFRYVMLVIIYCLPFRKGSLLHFQETEIVVVRNHIHAYLSQNQIAAQSCKIVPQYLT